MATARREPEGTSTDSDEDIRDPDLPMAEQAPVPPGMEEVSPGVTTMAGLFGPATVVDEVQQIPYQPTDQEFPQVWVIRPNTKIEDMSVGSDLPHMAFDPGVRYRVPFRVAEILADRDLLMEIPFPYEPQAARR